MIIKSRAISSFCYHFVHHCNFLLPKWWIAQNRLNIDNVRKILPSYFHNKLKYNEKQQRKKENRRKKPVLYRSIFSINNLLYTSETSFKGEYAGGGSNLLSPWRQQQMSLLLWEHFELEGNDIVASSICVSSDAVNLLFSPIDTWSSSQDATFL